MKFMNRKSKSNLSLLENEWVTLEIEGFLSLVKDDE